MNTMKTSRFLQQLGTMLESGVPLLRGLKTLAGCVPGRLGEIAGHVRASVERGAPLHVALSEHGGFLTPVEQALVKVGEESGTLDGVLMELAARREAQSEVRKRIATRLIYPAIVLHLAMCVGTLLAVVSPEGGVMAGVRFLVKAVLVVYGLGFGLYYGYTRRWLVPSVGRMVDRLAYNAPLVGRMVRRTCLVRFCQAFEAMYVGGIAHPRALALSAESCGNFVFRSRLQQAVPMVSNGIDLGEALQMTGAFDPETVSRLITGVQSGRIEETLALIRKQAELDARTASDRLAVVLPTGLYLLVVIWAASIVFRFYAAYFARINDVLNQ